MRELTASRTLVKSPPELWAECSDAASLSRHLDRFGEIRITRLEPETVVAWEGESASGTVRLEPSGWGTKVVLTAQPGREVPPAEVADSEAAVAPPDADAEADAEVVDLPAPVADDPEPPIEEPLAHAPAVEEVSLPAVVGPTRPGPLARLLGLFRRRPAAGPEAEPVAEPEPEPEPSTEAEPLAVAEPEEAAAPEPEPVAGPEAPAADPPPAVALELMALEQALDSLGQAHHRPFSRA